MKQNKYDDPEFYQSYKQMSRSIGGLEAAGEWHAFQALLPELSGKDVLDLGCGFGWHCRYVREQGARSAVGVDISKNMLQRAGEMTDDPAISYLRMPIEDIRFTASRFDVVISSLALHYINSYNDLCRKVYDCLKPGGRFIFSVEHPIFTAREEQDWHYDETGRMLHWPVDHYQSEGKRTTSFLTDNVIKYHRTLSTYIQSLVDNGFTVQAVKEPLPSEVMLRSIPGMEHEARRPMFLILSAAKPVGS